jgi:enoyl-CoA hydratase/carnithine racemase
LANELAERPAEAVAALKRLLRHGMDLDLPEALDLESRVAARLAV